MSVDNNHHQRRPSCVRARADDAGAGEPAGPAVSRNWSVTLNRLLDFADELSEKTLGDLSVTVDDYGFIAVLADIVDATGNVSARLVLTEPRLPNPDDAIGLIVLPSGAQPGDGLVLTRPRA